MSRRGPGERLHRLLALVLDRDTLARLVEPTLADLDHEVVSAGQGWPRVCALLRGYRALARVLLASAWDGPFAPARAGTIVALGVVGAALANWARVSGLDGRVGNSGLLLPMLVSPILFHAFDRRSSYGGRFLTSAAAGAVACLGLDLAATFGHPAPMGWHMLWFAIGGSLVLVSSALGAAAVWNPFHGAPLPRQALAGVFYSGATTTVVFFARNTFQSTVQLPLDVLRTPFYVVFFGTLLAATVLPAVLLARRWIRLRGGVALVALACFPAPIVASSMVEGQSLPRAVIECLHWSLPMLTSSLPFMAGTMALGWVVGTRRGPNPA